MHDREEAEEDEPWSAHLLKGGETVEGAPDAAGFADLVFLLLLQAAFLFAAEEVFDLGGDLFALVLAEGADSPDFVVVFEFVVRVMEDESGVFDFDFFFGELDFGLVALGWHDPDLAD